MQARRPGCGARARGAPPCSPRARWHTPDRQQRRVRRVERQAAAAGRRQVDAVLARLGMLKERIDATEACIALDLDHRRNELVAYNLVRVRSVHGSAHPAEQRGLASAQSLQGACMRRVPRGGRCALRATVPCGAPCDMRALTAAPGQDASRHTYTNPLPTLHLSLHAHADGSGGRAQALTIFTVAITWVAMTASIFGQNLYFNIAATPLVRLTPPAACNLRSPFTAALTCVKHACSGRGTPRRSRRCSSPLSCWLPCWSMHGAGGCCLFRRPSCDTSACPAFATAGACMSWADVSTACHS
jgi:hypothetical protein